MNDPNAKFDLNLVDNVIFDLGAVIIDIDFDLTTHAFATLAGVSFHEADEKIKKLDVYDIYERGKLSDAQFRDFLRDIFNLNQSDQEIDAAWNALLLELPKERVELVKKISDSKRTFLLSNTSNIHIMETNNILQKSAGVGRLNDMVEKAYFSYEIEMRKPDREIYEYVLQDSGLDPQRTLFVDDNADNIIGANAVGLHTLHLVAPNDIRKALII